MLTANAASTQAGVVESCTLEAYLFTTTVMRDLTVRASDGDCKLYDVASDLALDMQSWVCAGAISANYGRQENLVMCREAGRPVEPSLPISCMGLADGTPVRFSSGPGELPGDVVGDLDATVMMPGRVTITGPTALGVTTWPDFGPLEVRWTSTNPTSGLVTLTPRGTPGLRPQIVCQPRTNGTLNVPAALIDMANMRTTDIVVRVASYRDVTATAESGMNYRVYAGFTSVLLMQARR